MSSIPYIIYSIVTRVNILHYIFLSDKEGWPEVNYWYIVHGTWKKKILNEKPDTKDHILYHFIHMKHSEEVSPWRDKVD